jgi:hypothetical protein
MMRCLRTCLMLCGAWLAFERALLAAEDDAVNAATVIVVVGAPGSDEYAKHFAEWAGRWKQAAERGKAKFVPIGPIAGDERDRALTATSTGSAEVAADRGLLRDAIAAVTKRDDESASTTWIVLIGHGTFDGKKAKFNLRGEDVTADDMADWLKDTESPVAIVNCASASGPFINRLSAPNRAIVTATKSGSQYNFARFGDYMSAAIGDASLDLDKDKQTSLLEAYLAASARTAEFYKQETRLATEHSLLDDNGDGLGTPADWFRGFRAVRQAKSGASADGSLAARLVLIRQANEQSMPADLAKRRDAIEARIADLRGRKAKLDEDEYYAQLERMLLELASCYDEAEHAAPMPDTPSPKN